MSTLSLLERYGRDSAGSRVIALRCRACGFETPVHAGNVCDRCFGPLDVQYDYAAVARRLTHASIDSGPPSIWRYAGLLPVELDGDEPVTLGEGFTPLIPARNLGERLGLRNLYLKNDTVNPTGSFKDRVVSVAVTWARRKGFGVVACASTGNLATAVAAYAARAPLQAVIFVPCDLEAAKIRGTTVYNPTLVRVDGSYDDVNRLCSELADRVDWGFCNINLRPFYSEGSKTLTFETAEQLGWRLPDEIVIPVASGCQFVKHHRAATELLDLGLVPQRPLPRFTGAQAAGCAPVASAYADGAATVTPVRPETIARSIAIGNPSDGADVLRIARATGGTVAAAREEEIAEGIELLAGSEGIYAETAGGVTVSVLRRLAEAGRWRGDETVVAYITGNGLKTPEAAPAHVLDDPIRASVRAFQERFPSLG
ncbi:MAG: threonine synthase [Candidatus Dormibacteraeota bacterium]|nr:threonine synthase [Candidatus Dormibacteraeota bacterium]MBV9524281.1 threonine synthase [Candidatus Dormibacteraeota bacterium]